MSEWTEGVASDGAVILRDGEPVTIVDVLDFLNRAETALRGIVNHWHEFGDVMIAHKDDYGQCERIDAAAKLLR